MTKPLKVVPPEERQKNFLSVFRHFDSKSDAVAWISEVTGSSKSTVWIWRCKGKKSGYKIPRMPYAILMNAVKVKFKEFL